MRIAVMGTAGQGKTTLINDFIANWPLYKKPSNDYRELLKEKKYPHSKNCSKEGQWAILNCLIDEMQKYSKTDKVIFDRGPLDVLVYSLWACEMGSSDIDEAFIQKLIPIVKESLNHLDLIFFVPITKHAPIQIVDNGIRDTDPQYIAEIDNIFKALFHEYQHGLGKTPFFSADDCPAIIEIFGNPQERILLIQQYLNVEGEVIGEEADTILNPENIEELEKLILEQADADKKEKYLKEQEQMVKDFVKNEKKKVKRS
jgi:GTPase SAR1 family protein